MADKLPHLVCYDIRCPRRLARVHRFLKRQGLPLQYSVFLLQLTPKQRDRLIQNLRIKIDEQADDIRIYPLPGQPDWCTIGKELFSEGVQLYGVELPPQAP